MELHNNGKKLDMPERLHFERNPVKCQRCQTVFQGFIFEEIDGLVQLRTEQGLVEHLKLRCLFCGELFNWNIAEKTLRQAALHYKELVAFINQSYHPE